VTNVGADMSFGSVKKRLLTTARLGVAAYPFFETFMTSFELEKKVYGGTVIRNGFELSFSDQYNLRTVTAITLAMNTIRLGRAFR